MPSKPLIALLLAVASSASHADNCEAIAAQIAARMQAGGLAPRLVTIDKGTASAGQVVGTCANGSRQIVQWPTGASTVMAPGALPAARVEATDDIATECKDGRVVRGPDCSQPAARAASARAAAAASVRP